MTRFATEYQDGKKVRYTENAPYEEARKWIAREKPRYRGYYQIQPVLSKDSSYSEHWHCFYIKKDSFDRYLSPYVESYLYHNVRFQGKVLIVDKLHMLRLFAPLVNEDLPKLTEKVSQCVISDMECTEMEFLEYVKWEFYNTFFSFLERIYCDFEEEQPDIAFRLIS